MNIEKALTTPGFMAESELTYLASIAKKAELIAEIGSWQGRSARAFADNTRGFVVCCDTWADNAYGSAPAEVTCHPEWLKNAFRENTKDCTNILAWRMNSVEGAEKAARVEMTFDIIFIDAGHNYEDVKADIFAWLPLLRVGGILCGHDYAPYHPGVVRAVDQFVPSRRIVPGTTLWTTEGV